MYLRFPIFLTQAGAHNGQPEYHTDDYVIECLETLGWSLPSRIGPDGNRATTYTTEIIQPGTEVGDRCLLHYRDLAAKNGAKVFGDRGQTEVKKFGLYFGSLPADEANVYVARISDEVLTVFISQRDVSKLHSCSQNIVEKLMSLPIANRSRTVGQKATVYSSEGKVAVGEGRLHERSLQNLLKSARAEVLTLVTAVSLFFITGLVANAPAEINDWNIRGVVGFASELWKACLGAAIGSALTLTAIYFGMDRTFIRFGTKD